MAGEGSNLNLARVNEVANSNFAFGFEQLTALAPTQLATKSQAIPYPVTKLFIYSDYEIYWSWSLTAAATDVINTTNSMKLPAKTLVQMNVPWGKLLEKYEAGGHADSIYFQVRTVSNNTASVRLARG